MPLFTGNVEAAECDIEVVYGDSYTLVLQSTDGTEADNVVPLTGYSGDAWIVDPDGDGDAVANWIVSVDGPAGTVTATLPVSETNKLSTGTKYAWALRLFSDTNPDVDTTTVLAGFVEVKRYKGAVSG